MSQTVSAMRRSLTSAQTTSPEEILCLAVSRIITTGQPTDGAGEPDVTLPMTVVAFSSANIDVPVRTGLFVQEWAPTRCHVAPPLNSASVLSAP